ncbi:MAG: hypothetical protein M0P31_00890 [Solirubrobacteraceae bacterium]|nr:hypothetical protein [Solirubrobacteraceae bacterium]
MGTVTHWYEDGGATLACCVDHRDGLTLTARLTWADAADADRHAYAALMAVRRAFTTPARLPRRTGSRALRLGPVAVSTTTIATPVTWRTLRWSAQVDSGRVRVFASSHPGRASLVAVRSGFAPHAGRTPAVPRSLS